MVNIWLMGNQKPPGSPGGGSSGGGSPREEVGEIDTRAPFESVKAAVSLFGEVAVSKEKRAVKKSKLSSENVLDKETQLLLAQKELNGIKQKLQSAETTKIRVLSDLGKANITLRDLTTKLKTVSKSKESAIAAAEAVKKQARQLQAAKSSKSLRRHGSWKQELDHARENYASAFAELDSSKQELTKIRQDFDAALEEKLAAFQQAAESQRSAKLSKERVCELSKEIATMHESQHQLKVASQESQEQQAKIIAEKEARLQSYKTAKEEAEKKLLSLKKDLDPEQARNIEKKLAETTMEIEALQEEMKKAHASDMDTVRAVTAELNEATRTLQEVAEEESSLRNLVRSLTMELENVKSESAEFMEKEARTESVAAALQTELENGKAEIESPHAEGTSYGMILNHQQLISETENARKETEEMKKNAEELKQEAETARIAAKEAEEKLQLAVREAEEAKAAEKSACDEMKNYSTAPVMNSESGNKIKMTLQELECLSRKPQELENLAEIKVAAATFQLEAIKGSQIQTAQKLEANLNAIKEIEEAIDSALKQAEMAEAAKKAVEGELQRWHKEEQKIAAVK